MNDDFMILPLGEIAGTRLLIDESGNPVGYDGLFAELAEVYCHAFGKMGREVEIRRMIEEEWRDFGHRYLVALQGHRIVGFVSWRRDGRPEHGLVELYHIGSYRRTGVPRIGDRLIAAMIEDADRLLRHRGSTDGLRLVWLRTAKDGPAELFYRRFGFQKLECALPDHWRDGHDEVVYQLRVREWRQAKSQQS